MHQFNPKTKIVCAVTFAIIGGIICAPNAQAQPMDGVAARNEVAVTLKDYGLSVDVRAQSVKLSQIMAEIAEKTNINYIMYDDAEVASVRVEKLSLTQAIKRVAAAADLSVKMVDATYVIEKRTEIEKNDNGKTKDFPIDLEFRDMPIQELMRTLQTQLGIKIEVAPQVSGVLAVIRFTNETSASIIDKVARSAKLSLTKTEAGVYRLGFDGKKTE